MVVSTQILASLLHIGTVHARGGEDGGLGEQGGGGVGGVDGLKVHSGAECKLCGLQAAEPEQGRLSHSIAQVSIEGHSTSLLWMSNPYRRLKCKRVTWLGVASLSRSPGVAQKAFIPDSMQSLVVPVQLASGLHLAKACITCNERQVSMKQQCSTMLAFSWLLQAKLMTHKLRAYYQPCLFWLLQDKLAGLGRGLHVCEGSPCGLVVCMQKGGYDA